MKSLLAVIAAVAALLGAVQSQTKDELDIHLCPDCPYFCYPWCVRTRNNTSPCAEAKRQLRPDSSCHRTECVDHYCGVPTAIFCSDEGKIDFSCLPHKSLLKQMQNFDCWKWLESRCKRHQPIAPPSPPPPISLTLRDRCRGGCPDECGRLCTMTYAIMAPCSLHRMSNQSSSCQSAVCHDSYCSAPHSYFCNNGQLDTSCTTDYTAQEFLNSNQVCRNWYLGQCQPSLPIRIDNLTPGVPKERTTTEVTAIRSLSQRMIAPADERVKVSPPAPENTPARRPYRRRFTSCMDDCPSECGDMCRMINAFANPCRVMPGECPRERCQSFYCSSPFALVCTEDNQIDYSCTGSGAQRFLNSENPVCRNWLHGKCQRKPEPTRSLSKRAANFRPCKPDCPVRHCGAKLCNKAEAIRAPCRMPNRPTGYNPTNYNNAQCSTLKCVDFYCGAPSKLYCMANGTMDVSCTYYSDHIARQFLGTRNINCINWFFDQCKTARTKQPAANPAQRPATPAYNEIWRNVVPGNVGGNFVPGPNVGGNFVPGPNVGGNFVQGNIRWMNVNGG